MRRLRIGLLVPHWKSPFEVLGYDLKEELRGLGHRVARALEPHVDVPLVRVISSREDGAEAGRAASTNDLDALLVLQTVVVPPAYALEALRQLPGLPIVLWAAHRHQRISASYDHVQIAADGATVGTPMLTNMLVREQRAFELIMGPLEDTATLDGVVRALEAAGAAGRLARARIGRIGRPIDGYDCVDADDAALAAGLGTSIVSIDPAEFSELFLAVDPERVSELDKECHLDYDVDLDTHSCGYIRSLRAACAVEDLVARHRLDAGVMNCHVPEIRLGDKIGIAPCFGLGRMTTAGVPWTCAGDVLTAIAMLALKLLGGAALYHELESLDYSNNQFVIANTGEHDLAFGAQERPQLIENQWYRGDPIRGACAYFSAAPGPATLVAFTQLSKPSRHRFIVASGEITGESWPGVGTPHAGFRFASGPAAAAWPSWCQAGANHHSAATPGDLGPAITAVGRHLGVEVIQV